MQLIGRLLLHPGPTVGRAKCAWLPGENIACAKGKHTCNKCVSFEFRYGTWEALAAKALKTSPAHTEAKCHASTSRNRSQTCPSTRCGEDEAPRLLSDLFMEQASFWR